MPRQLIQKALKIVHEIAAAALIGALGSCFFLVLASIPVSSAAAVQTIAFNIQHLVTWLALPALVASVVSGLISMALRPEFYNALWVWVKALLGLSMFEGVVLALSKIEENARTLNIALKSPGADLLRLEPLLRGDLPILVTLFVLALANLVLGVWRPRFNI